MKICRRAAADSTKKPAYTRTTEYKRVTWAEREGCKPNLLTPYIVVVYIPLRFNCSQIVAMGEYFENTHSYCCEICSLAFLGFKGTNK